ncbi:MAG TPA: hypothetical protein PLO37_12880 [Candidatus Hydrogenedentes bacterium]|nr:hypothetical protein [Candidatus Hydrogenedentota bacterium]HPG67737.1 hypothetical protein [Candidatus Hydrogenedentota bacterium]
MGIKWLLAFLPVLGLAVHVVANVVSYRGIRRLGMLKSLIYTFALGLVSVAVATVAICLADPALRAELLPYLIVNGIAYGALGYDYFHFINLNVTARRPRIMGEFLDAQRPLTLEDITARYDSALQVRVRVKRLVDSGQIVERDGRYFIGRPTMLYITRFIMFMKLVMLGKRSEFE